MPEAYIRGLGHSYVDGPERMEIWISKKEASTIPHTYGMRIPIRLRIGDETFEAGIRSTSRNEYVWICPDLRDELDKKVRLSEILINFGFQKNQKIFLQFKGKVLHVRPGREIK